MASRKDVKIVISAKDLASKALRGTVGLLRRVKSAVFSLRSAFVLLAGAAGIGAVTKSLVSTASAFEDLRTQLNALQGSSQAGKEALDWIKEFAKETPLSLQGVTRAFVMARAFGLDPMDGTMQSLVDINSKLGGKMEKLIFITRGVGQMFTKGRISAQEMNLQLTEQGVPAWELLAKAMNRANDTTKFTTASLQKMSEKGLLGKDAVKLLIAEMGRFGEGAAIANMTKFSGLAANFGDEIDKAKDAFARADNGLLVFAKGSLQLGIEKLTEFRETGDLKKWGTDFATDIIGAMESGVKAIIFLIDALGGASINMLILQRGVVVIGNKFDSLNLKRLQFELGVDKLLFGDDEKSSGLKREINDIKNQMRDSSTEALILDTQINKVMSDITRRAVVAKNAFEDLKKAVAESASKALEPKNADGATGNKVQTVKVEDSFADVFRQRAEEDRVISLTQRNIIAEIDVESAAQRLAADQEFKAVELENESLHFERLMEINMLLSQSQLDIRQETRDRLAEMSAEDAALEITRLQQSVEAVRESEISKSKVRIQANQQSLLGAVQIGAAIVGASKASAKANFLITKAAGIASILINTQAAAQLAMATILPPANFAVAAKIEAAGFRRAGIAAAVGLTQSIGVGGGGGGGFSGSTIGNPQNFQGQQNQQQQVAPIINIRLEALDPSSISDAQMHEFGERIAEPVASAIGRGANDGDFEIQFERL